MLDPYQYVTDPLSTSSIAQLRPMVWVVTTAQQMRITDVADSPLCCNTIVASNNGRTTLRSTVKLRRDPGRQSLRFNNAPRLRNAGTGPPLSDQLDTVWSACQELSYSAGHV